MNYTIGTAFQAEYEGAMDLAWVTFSEFVAPYYPQKGIESFLEFISDPILFRMFKRGEYQMFLARNSAGIIGLATLRNNNQISLLFVDKVYHKMGVGTALVECLIAEVKEKKTINITVNSSPYAIKFYQKLGFEATAQELTIDGIIFTPMSKIL